jgi:hypothetical protein
MALFSWRTTPGAMVRWPVGTVLARLGVDPLRMAASLLETLFGDAKDESKPGHLHQDR